MNPYRRPSMAERTISAPQKLLAPTISVAHKDFTTFGNSQPGILTPPASPACSRHLQSSPDLRSSTITDESLPSPRLVAQNACTSLAFSPVQPNHTWTSIRSIDDTLICPFDVGILQDSRGTDQVYGHGAWSTVYKGTCIPVQGPSYGIVPTPPASPSMGPPIMVAVKRPARKDAVSIITSEARILSHIACEIDAANYVVPFYGLLLTDSSIVLAAIPHSLESLIKQSAIQAEAERTTWNMTEPVLGSERRWLDLASKLVSALSWLHDEAMVIHGDIKPSNILLFPKTSALHERISVNFTPLFSDFSSAQLIGDKPTPNTLSAITREYAAPELLSSAVLNNPMSTATTASDVFSLAITLLVAATGNTMVYTGSVWQRQAMATQGWQVLDNVRCLSDDGIRLPRHGLVQRALERAVLKKDMGRITAGNWSKMLKKMAMSEPSKS